MMLRGPREAEGLVRKQSEDRAEIERRERVLVPKVMLRGWGRRFVVCAKWGA